MSETLRNFYKKPGNLSSIAVGAARYGFEQRYDLVTKKLKKKFDVRIFQESETSYYYKILVPSDTRNLYYDVVIHFFETSQETHMSMKDWNVEFFSNCPSFVYNYAYAYNKKKLLIDSLYDKLGKDVLEKKPDERNPKLEIMWDKSIFYAIHHIMINAQYSQRYFVKRNALEYNPETFFDSIRSAKEIMEELSSDHGRKMDSVTLRRKLRETDYSKAKKVVKQKLKSSIKMITGLSNVKSGYRNSKGKITGKPKIGGKKRN